MVVRRDDEPLTRGAELVIPNAYLHLIAAEHPQREHTPHTETQSQSKAAKHSSTCSLELSHSLGCGTAQRYRQGPEHWHHRSFSIRYFGRLQYRRPTFNCTFSSCTAGRPCEALMVWFDMQPGFRRSGAHTFIQICLGQSCRFMRCGEGGVFDQ
jgi:hypothetical protein